jgi:hypothetical protein
MLDPTFINNMKTGPLYRYLLTKPDPAAQALEEQVRTTNLIFRNDIQGLLRVLYLGSE